MKGKSRKVFWRGGFRITVEHIAKDVDLRNFCPWVNSLKKGGHCLSYDPDTSTILADLSLHVVSMAHDQDSLIWQDKYYGYMIHRTRKYGFKSGDFEITITALNHLNKSEVYDKYCPQVFNMSVLKGNPDIPSKVLDEAKEIYQNNLEVPLLSVYDSEEKRYLFISPKQKRIVEEYDSYKIIFKRI